MNKKYKTFLFLCVHAFVIFSAGGLFSLGMSMDNAIMRIVSIGILLFNIWTYWLASIDYGKKKEIKKLDENNTNDGRVL